MSDKNHIGRNAIHLPTPVLGILGTIAIKRVGGLRVAEIKAFVLSLDFPVKR
jgi:hypothetical protein